MSDGDNALWDDAIKVAEEEIQVLARRVRQLQAAVRIFRANKRDGIPWPVPQKEGANV